MNPEEQPRLRGVVLDPLADGALPLLLTLQTGLAAALLSAMLEGLAGRPFLPGLGIWALLFAAESFLFTAFFFVRELDMPLVLRGVEATLMLLLAKMAATAPTTGWGLAALTEVNLLQSWVGLAVLSWAWLEGLRAARLAGALHPGLLPDPEAERIQQNDHGEAYAALRSRLLSTTAVVGALVGLLPVLAGPSGWTPPPGGRWLYPGLVLLAALAAAALFVAARLRQQCTWALERLAPPEGVLSRWAPQALALMLLPVLLALLLPAGPRLPVERLLVGGEERLEVRLEPARQNEDTGKVAWLRPEFLDQLAARSPDAPDWLRWLLLGAASLAALLLLGLALAVAYRQLAERLGWRDARGLLPLLRTLLRWYGALWQALWEGLRGAAVMAGRAAVEATEAVVGRTGLLARYLPAWGRPPGEPRAAVRFYFARLQADAARRGLARPPAATANEFGARLAEAVPEQAAEITALTVTYQEARYSPAPVGPEQASRARRAWLAVVRAISRR
ncbi:MAG: DUF4129 domain-containing protein [Bacillota bacterium]